MSVRSKLTSQTQNASVQSLCIVHCASEVELELATVHETGPWSMGKAVNDIPS